MIHKLGLSKTAVVRSEYYSAIFLQFGDLWKRSEYMRTWGV